ncbi:MAG TPA: zinc-dependent metalloprotease, partial [Xanthomonadales bacterium]|nr:zinc-dependent metalloprotease [Xanthomonadales bacterium]
PRTGEIIKGHVSLGSLRVRQDQMIAEALTTPFQGEGEGVKAAREMALARLRQLSAHEVGHTLGIDHNFAASYTGDASVMDYPHPNIYLDAENNIRLDQAYATGVSPWDKLAVRYGYTEFAEGTEAQSLRAILDEAAEQKIAFITDQDARAPGSAHPAANLWDNGTDAIARLDELLAIRQLALQQFSSAVIPDGTALFELESRLVPVFLLHRYQVDAVAKLLGGLNYDYRFRGDTPSQVTPVDAGTQLAAMDSLLDLLDPGMLALPQNLRYLVPPPPTEYRRDRENFPTATGAAFDHLAPARAGADLVLSELLQPQRLSRLAEQHALQPDQPDPAGMLKQLVASSWLAKPAADEYLNAIQTEVNWLVLQHLVALANSTNTIDSTRALGIAQLVELEASLRSKARKGDPQAIAAVQEIRRFLDRESSAPARTIDPAPPGSPIG